MSATKVTPEKAAGTIYDFAASAVEMVSLGYKKTLEVMGVVADKTESAHMRMLGITYKAKTCQAVLGGLKGVETQVLTEILRNPDISFKEKLNLCVAEMREGFSHDSTVAAAAYFGKSALIAPIALGVTAVVALCSPAAAAVAGVCAYKGLKTAACYFLSTHQGHEFEQKVASKLTQGVGFVEDKISAGVRYLKGLRDTVKSGGSEYDLLNNMSVQMDLAVASHQEHTGQKHEEKHGHEHHAGHEDHGHHHSALHTLKEDIKTVFGVLRKPFDAVQGFAQKAAADLVHVYNVTTGSNVTHGDQNSKFLLGAPKTESFTVSAVTADTPKAEAPVHKSKPTSMTM